MLILVHKERKNRKEDLKYSNLALKDHFLKLLFFWSEEECESHSSFSRPLGSISCSFSFFFLCCVIVCTKEA